MKINQFIFLITILLITITSLKTYAAIEKSVLDKSTVRDKTTTVIESNGSDPRSMRKCFVIVPREEEEEPIIRQYSNVSKSMCLGFSGGCYMSTNIWGTTFMQCGNGPRTYMF